MEDPNDNGSQITGLFNSAWIAIGQLLHYFAQVEGGVIEMFRNYIGLPDDEARAILGEARLSDNISTFRRLAKVRGMDAESLNIINELFGRIDILKKYRDCVAHRPISFQGEFPDCKAVFSRYLTAKDQASMHPIIYSIDELNTCTNEARILSIRVSIIAQDFSRTPIDQSVPITGRLWDRPPRNLSPSARLALQDETLSRRFALPTPPHQQSPHPL